MWLILFQYFFLIYSILFSSPEPKAHWWAYRVGRPPSSVCRPHSLNISSETAWPIKVKFHKEPPWGGGTKVCSNSPGHMTKMAAMPIKTLWNLLLRNQNVNDLESWYAASGAQVLPSLFKWWPWVDLDLIWTSQRFFETCNKWPKWQDVPVDIKILSPRGCQPLPRAIYMDKIMRKIV